MHTAVHSKSVNLVKLITSNHWNSWKKTNCDGATAIELALRMENEWNAIGEAMIKEMGKEDLEGLGMDMLEICKGI